MKTKKILGIAMLVAMLAAGSICAAAPNLVNYQGRLMDSGGAPVNGSVPVTLRVYSQDAGGSLLWSQAVGSVAVTNGLYSFQFGDGNLAAALTNAACWLELQVDGETLAPRQQLVSVPFAFKAQSAETATTAQQANSATDAQTLAGNSPSALMIPPGVVLPYAGDTIPSGYLKCYGQEISRSTYSNLFAAIGIYYGSGDGSTTFNVPDMRGRVPAGKDNLGGVAANRLTSSVAGATLGATGGVESVTLTPANYNELTWMAGQVDGKTLLISSSVNSGTFFGFGLHNPGQNTAHDNVQPTIILVYIIKY